LGTARDYVVADDKARAPKYHRVSVAFYTTKNATLRTACWYSGKWIKLEI
jgi:ADP-ribose pyrophosphatase YjhB (NUDIX family)